MLLQDALTYYANQLIIQYRDKSKANQTIKTLVNCAYCDGLPLQFSGAFDLDTATGNQLTIIGKIVGVPRNVYGLDLVHQFYSYSRWSGTPASIGFNRWGASNNTYLFSRWQTTATYTMTDFEMQSLISLKIIYNNYYKSLKTIMGAMKTVFSSNVTITDNLNMSVTFTVKQPYYNTFIIAEFLNILPKPMGVAENIVYI